MDLSILIPSKGRTKQLQVLVDHLHAMMPPGLSYEILIRDASPKNGTSVTGASLTFAQESPGEAVNHMAEEAKGTFLFPLGDDMRLYRRTIPTALVLMRQLPKGTLGIVFHEDPGFPCHAYLLAPEMWIVARETFHWLGGLDPQFQYGYSDCDLGLKAWHTKLPVISLLGVCVKHAHVDDGTKRHNMKEHFDQDQEKFFTKWPNRPISTSVGGHSVDLRTPKMCPYAHEN